MKNSMHEVNRRNKNVVFEERKKMKSRNQNSPKAFGELIKSKNCRN